MTRDTLVTVLVAVVSTSATLISNELLKHASKDLYAALKSQWPRLANLFTLWSGFGILFAAPWYWDSTRPATEADIGHALVIVGAALGAVTMSVLLLMREIVSMLLRALSAATGRVGLPNTTPES